MNKNKKATFLKGVAFALVALYGFFSFNVTAREDISGTRTLKRSVNVVTDNEFVFTYDINDYDVAINNFVERDEVRTWISATYNFHSQVFTQMSFNTYIWSADQEDGVTFSDNILPYFNDGCTITYYLTSVLGEIDLSSDDLGLIIENYDNDEVFSHWYNNNNNYIMISLNDDYIVRFGSVITYDDFITRFNTTLKLYQYGSTPLGLFENATIKYGLVDVNDNTFVNGYSTSFKRLNGGFLIEDSAWDVYYDYYSEQDDRSDLKFAINVDFGDGVDVTPYKRLVTLSRTGSDLFDYGQTIKFTFNNGYTYSVNGADVDYKESTFDLIDISNGATSRLITNIVFSGINTDYIPYGLKTSTDFTSGYDSGYYQGYQNGKNDGVIIGEEKANDKYYILGYQNGYDEGIKSAEHPITISQVLESVIKIPSTIISEGFDFEILGINIGELIKTLIVVALAIFAISIFRKG